jgi:hypothetical protein
VTIRKRDYDLKEAMNHFHIAIIAYTGDKQL